MMNFDELNELVAREAGVSICPVCSVPFAKRNPRQKTCGSTECKRLWRNRYFEDRRRRMLAENPEEFRAYRRAAEKKTRRKKKERERMKRNYKKMQSYWERQIDVKEHKIDGGLDYGKKQIEKTLAQVPKIDVNIGDKNGRK